MGIKYFENERVFRLDTVSSTYMIGIVDAENFLGHIYYGKKVADNDLRHLMRLNELPFVPSQLNRERQMFMECFPMEYPTHGVGDFRQSCLEVKTTSGHNACLLSYVSHKIYKGKPKLENLPSTYASEDDCTTLEIICEDALINIRVTLVYTAFEHINAITRSVRVENTGTEPLYIKKILSACLDIENEDFELITLHGAWARERHIKRNKIVYGRQSIASFRGKSSAQEHPFFAIVENNSTQHSGEVYAMNFVYSGNFSAQIELDQIDFIRATMGINDVDFEWKLESGDIFTAPEVVMVYSSEGIGGMTRTFHDLYRKHLIRGIDKKRPVLINNWEATYFDFDDEKLLQIAEQASKLGIEMLVMDDGWFGERNDDNTSLGDWTVNEQKIKCGLHKLVEKVNKLGMEFGIWFEPEMISPDSELYRQHPDWAVQVPNRTAALTRNQYVLDITRPEVKHYIYNKIKSILSSANITYVKWDMNRCITDIGSYGLPADQQGEFCHRYMLAVYHMQEMLLTDFPNILLENCSGGGARFDPGMLYYSPQIWCSDDTDAIERLSIQEGTALIYPLSCIGAHVSDSPNHVLGRSVPFETRGDVALSGTFGYELDITKIPKEDKDMIPTQIQKFHKYKQLIKNGDYYRISSYSENHSNDCWQVVSKDKTKALVTYIQVMNEALRRSKRIKLQGLDENKLYKIEETGEIFSGSTLMYAGINIQPMHGDFKSRLVYISEAKQ